MLDLIPHDMAAVLETERRIADGPQILLRTENVFHAGLYARTIMVPRGVTIAGALIVIPTLLIVSGDVDVIIGRETTRITGYAVLEGQAGRKQAFHAHADTHLTMLFATDAQDVTDAEEQFTDEAGRLGSRREGDDR